MHHSRATRRAHDQFANSAAGPQTIRRQLDRHANTQLENNSRITRQARGQLASSSRTTHGQLANTLASPRAAREQLANYSARSRKTHGNSAGPRTTREELANKCCIAVVAATPLRIFSHASKLGLLTLDRVALARTGANALTESTPFVGFRLRRYVLLLLQTQN